MTEEEALKRMIAPGTVRPGKWRGGVIQVWVTRACDKSCFNCTQGSNLAGKPEFITVEQFENALKSLKGYFGVVGMFGGNPATHPQFAELCSLMRTHVPYRQRGLWSNNPLTVEKAAVMRSTFNPAHSNLNVHLDRKAYEMFKEGWPESLPFGLDEDSRHSPPYVAIKDVLKKCLDCGSVLTKMSSFGQPVCDECGSTNLIYDEPRGWELISNCDINKHWSAMIGVFRGELRAWFCEIAGAQAMLHQHKEDYPDTGLDPDGLHFRYGVDPKSVNYGRPLDLPPVEWWRLTMEYFRSQVRKHCHDCGIPLRGYGELAQGGVSEQVSMTHEDIYKPKRPNRHIEIVTEMVQLGTGRIGKVVDYIPNGRK